MSESLMIHNSEHNPIYEIVIEKDFHKLADKISALGLGGRKACIITDSNTYSLYSETVAEALKPVCSKVISYHFPAGELNKNLDVIRDIYKTLITEKFDRKDFLVALGGGVTGDMTGFAAATYLRGITFIQVPTTLLSQSDSSVGGKTGVDFDGYKNMVGAFCMPALVYMNTAVLKTMDRRAFLSGMGEVIKHGLIRDRSFFSWIMENRTSIMALDEDTLIRMDARNCAIKGAVVEEDPTEKGIRSLLNFGHTLGHAIEKQKADCLYHGECVSIGCTAAAYISYLKGYITLPEANSIKAAFSAFGLPVSVSGIDKDAVIAATRNDKKVQGSTLKFILLRAIGDAVINTDVTDSEMRKALEYISENNQK